MTLPKVTPIQESAMIEACAYGVVQDNVKAVTVTALLGKGLIELKEHPEGLEPSYAPTNLGYKVMGTVNPNHIAEEIVEPDSRQPVSKPSNAQLDALLDLHIYGVVQESVKTNTRKSLVSKGWISEDPNGDYHLTADGYKVIGAVPPVETEETPDVIDEIMELLEPVGMWGENSTDGHLADWEIELLGDSIPEETAPASKMPDVWSVVPNREDKRRERRVNRAASRLAARKYDQRVKRWGVGNVLSRVPA
jgi:hypothetical protein